MNIFKLVVDHFPVTYLPEAILHYLAGDECLDALDSATFDSIFTQVYTLNLKKVYTHIDKDHKILHSFRDNPAELNESKGIQCWYKNGKLHRENDKPSLVYPTLKMWLLCGVLHRSNGQPAIIRIDGTMEWWEHGKFIKK